MLHRLPPRAFLLRCSTALAIWLLAGAAADLWGEEPAEEAKPAEFDQASLDFFEAKVRPLLVARCYECHSGGAVKLEGGLRLDSRATTLKGGDTGPAIKPGSPKESLLVDAVNYGDLYQMPPKSKLPPDEIAVFTKWVELGAPWPKEVGPKTAEPDKTFNLQARKEARWCWQPVRPQAPPAVKNAAWAKHPLDNFILARLEEKGLAPAPPANPRALIRRVYFDLIGLPPSAEEVESFVNDPSPQALARVVDQLLESPHFGERWARHWMDLVRYAETFGHEFDYPIPHATGYRDYLIRAFNADVPYNELVMEHLAGDLLDRPRRHPTEGYNESMIGTGFWWFGEAIHAPVDARADEAGRVDNQIDVMTKTFLGVTVACARCHDHKFDAISTNDYYALAGFVKSSRRQEAMLDPHGKITEAAKQMREARAQAGALLATVVPKPNDQTPTTIARYLLSAGELLRDSSLSAETVAGRANLDPARLSRWVKALADVTTKKPAHPMYPFAVLASRAEAPQPREFDALRKQLTRPAKPAEDSADDGSVLFADFNDGTFNGWFITGEAFGESPTRPRQWDAQAGGLRSAVPGVAHSGIVSNRLRGVLRSPTFTITKKHILYRLAGQAAQIRLIIDGYTMDTYSALLFGGAAFNVDTQGKFVWHTQSGDVGRYLGHRAHIELIDHGDGFVAVDEIRFSDQGPPSAEANPIAIEALGERETSLESLAAAYGKSVYERLNKWHAGQADAAATHLVNWGLEHELFEIDSAGLEAAKTQISTTAKRLDELASNLPSPKLVMAMTDGTGENERVFIRGNPRTPGEVAPRQILEALRSHLAPRDEAHLAERDGYGVRGSGRLELARRIADPANPLTARVMVNRVWHHLLGRGIVGSVDNFGVLGQDPTHPELLDYLAGQFTADGWSLKRLIRSVVLSSTYQMSSAPDGKGDELDPQNLLWHRAPIRRLQGEAIRDAILSLSGRLDPAPGGGSVNVHLTPFMQGRGRPGTSGPLDGNGRRSVYVEVRRNFLPPMMLAFDTPIPFSTMGRRNVSNVPAQALILMNDPFVVQQAEAWAKRLLAPVEKTPGQRVLQMYLSAFGRPPTEQEQEDALAFLDEQGRELGLDSVTSRKHPRVWADLCHVILNVKEFIFLN